MVNIRRFIENKKFRKNNYLNMKKRKQRGYWTYERCKDVALECKTKKELSDKYISVIEVIRKNKWFELILHFNEVQKPKGYWTYDKCKDVALKCKNNKELRNFDSVFNSIRRNKWFDLTYHFIELQKHHGYWTYEKCKMESLKFNSRIEMRENTSAYYAICKNKWFDLFEHMVNNSNTRKRLIYVYEFSDNCCYVGLTGNIKVRNNRHLKIEKTRPIFKHMSKTNLIPNLNIKTDYLPIEDAKKLENDFINMYRKNGWIVLNKIKGGTLGGNIVKWNKESCEKDVKKYNKLSTFRKNSQSSYYSILKNGWFDEICSHLKRSKVKNGYWNNKELCKFESEKYKNKTTFFKKCGSAYEHSRKNGWLNEFFPKNY